MYKITIIAAMLDEFLNELSISNDIKQSLSRAHVITYNRYKNVVDEEILSELLSFFGIELYAISEEFHRNPYRPAKEIINKGTEAAMKTIYQE